jgi:hypothetical protein
VIYPTVADIEEYFAKLPTEVQEEFAPLLESAQGRYRRVWQLEAGNDEKRIEVLWEFAANVFQTRAAKLLRAHSGSFDAFRCAISLDGGFAELGFWYAHRLYNLVELGRMPKTWLWKIEPHLWDRIREAENLWYTPDLVPDGWEKFFGPGAAAGAETPAPSPVHEPYPTAGNVPGISATTEARWEDLEICFLSDERVQIKIGGRTETRNFAEMGFADGRNGIPNKAWETLRILAEKRGTLNNARGTDNWANVEKRVQEIRQRLRQLHPAKGEPLPFVEKNVFKGKVSGYEARFRIFCAPAYRS